MTALESTFLTGLNDITEVRLEDADVVWEMLTERLEALTEAWDSSSEPPVLENFVPDGPPAVRRLTLVELIKVDLEYRWTDRLAPKVLPCYSA